MASKRQKNQLMNTVGLALAGYGLYTLFKAREGENRFGAPLDDDDFHAFGSADDPSMWDYFPGSPQVNNVIPFPKKDGYLTGIGPTPMGPVLSRQVKIPGLSHQQVLQVKLRQQQLREQRANDVDDLDGFGAMMYAGIDPYSESFGAYGDACSRLERKYKKRLRKYNKKKKQFKRRGRRFLGIRVGDGSKRLATLKKKYRKTREKAVSKGCEWPTRKQRKKALKSAEAEQRRIEAQMETEFQQAQENIAETSAAIASQAGQSQINPLFIIGGVGIVAVALLAMRRKSAATA